MRTIIDFSTDPYFNLAAEEYLFSESSEAVFRLWQNDKSIIVGRNQNALAEINSDYVRKNNIPVIRRMSGGGAVFHDLGNINFTFIDKRNAGEDSADMFRRFTLPIINTLKELGVDAYLEGRNDLLISGRKFSGNAIYTNRERVLQHGTLLFSSSIINLSAALNTRPEKFIGKGVSSNISRVTNISEHLPEKIRKNLHSPEKFIEYLYQSIFSQSELQGSISPLRGYTDSEIEGINKLRNEKYIKDEWNYGKSPKYTFSNSLKLTSGFYEVYMDIEAGKIASCKIQGDYFFLKPTSDIERGLIGLSYSNEVLSETLRRFNLSEYFSIHTTEEAEAFKSLFIL